MKPASGKPNVEVAAGRLLRELADVADVALEDVDAAGDGAVEQVRLGEGDLVVLRARAACSDTRRLSPRPRKFEVWNDSWPKKPSNCDTPAPNVIWLRFCSSNFSLTSTLFVCARRRLDVDVLALPSSGLK